MTLLSCLIIQILWVFYAKGQVVPCDYPHIENGVLIEYHENHKERAFPAQLDVSLYYRCLDGYISENEERWPLIRCTKVGWSPAPKCLKKCFLGHLENGRFLYTYLKTTYKEGDEISYVCFLENLQAKVTCTKNGWSPTPRCILNTPVCEEPPAIDFGGIVSDQQSAYWESDKVQYKCDPGYSLMGTEWITCSGKTWTPAPQCLAPCSITKQQLEAKNLLLSNGRRHAQLIQSDHTLEFMCSEGHTLTTPSVRKCVNGHMDLPSCISENGKNCSHPPTIENGDITTFLEKGYTSGSFVEFKCQKFYAMEGQNRSFCDNGNWTKAPLCLEPCAISVQEMENRMVELNGRANETIFQWVYLKHSDFLELRCKPGYALATNLSQSTFMVQCHGNPIVYPECKEIVCDPPKVVNGRVRPQRDMYKDGDVIIISCNDGFHIHNGQNTAECTKNGWLPPPRCSSTPD